MINSAIDRASCTCSADLLIDLAKKLLVYLDKECTCFSANVWRYEANYSNYFVYLFICLFVPFSVIYDVLMNSKECTPQVQSSILLSRTGSRSQCRQESSYQKDISDLPLSPSCLLYYFYLILEKRESTEESWHKIDFLKINRHSERK